MASHSLSRSTVSRSKPCGLREAGKRLRQMDGNPLIRVTHQLFSLGKILAHSSAKPGHNVEP
jgi:hypothetical protein